MASLSELIASYTPLTPSGEQWLGECIFSKHEGRLEVIGERWRCVCGVHENHDDATGFMLLAIPLLGEREINPVFLEPEPALPRYGLHRVAERPDATVLITDHRKAAKVGEALLPTYIPCAWPDGGSRWDGLDPLRGRAVLLWPTPGQEDAMRRLWAVLGALGCTGKVVEGIDLAAWTGSQDELVAAAKGCVRILTVEAQAAPAEPNPVAEAVPGALPGSIPADAGNEQREATSSPSPSPEAAGPTATLQGAQEPRSEPEAPPVAEFPAEATSTRPRKRRLRVAGGTDVDIPDPDADALPHELSESGIAAHFVALHKDKFRTVHQWAGKQGACWMSWDGSRWLREPNRVSAMQRGQTLAHGVKYWDAAKAVSDLSKVKFESRKFIGAFLDLASYAPEFVATPEVFDADPLMLGTPAGTVLLEGGKLVEPEREHYITRQTAIAPASGPHPLFDDVIHRASGGDKEITQYLWNWLGYLLTGLTKEKSFLYLFGKTDSGKTTLANAIANILGDADSGGYAAQCDVEMFTESKLDKGNDRLAHLAGARFAYASEMEEGRNFKSALLKLATGGDTLQGRFLYAEKFSFRATHKLWIFGNHKMHMKSSDSALINRLHMLEYQDAYIVSAAERDNNFQEKLKAEYPAILASMIRAAVNYLDLGGLGRPARIAAAVEDYATSEDTMGQFIQDCLQIESEGRSAAGETYETFRKWAEKEGAFAPSSKRFSQQLIERGFGRDRSGGVRYFVGFTIKLGATL